MSKRLIGVKVGADQVLVVLLTHVDENLFTLEDETKLNLQGGDRSQAYDVIYGQFLDYIRNHKADFVSIKGSALSRSGGGMGHLEAAELRGVIRAAAAASKVEVRMMSKAATSRNFGGRKVDEYLKDDAYWDEVGLSSLAKGLREAAFAAIAESAK